LNTNGTSTVSYIDNSDTPGASTTLTLSVNDNGNSGSGGSLIGSDTATINITAVNDAPQTAATSGSGNEDTTIAVSLSGSDIDGTVASFKITSAPSNGTLYADAGLTQQLLAGGSVTATGNAATVFFKPNLNVNGSDSFTYAAV